MLHRGVLGAAVGEREPEVVERHRLGVRVAQVADDRERCEVLLGRLLGLAVAPELRPERIELVGALAGVDRVKPQEPESIHGLIRPGCEALRSCGRRGGRGPRAGSELSRVLANMDFGHAPSVSSPALPEAPSRSPSSRCERPRGARAGEAAALR